MTTRMTFVAVGVLVISGCSGSVDDRGASPASCVAGQTQACTCADGQPGAQVCASDGQSWGACQCSGPAASDGGLPPPVPLDGGTTWPPPTGDSGTGSTGGTGTLDCAQVDACMANCTETDTACFDACYYQGTASAQAQMTALENCMDSAEQGTCQSQCATYSQQCEDCLDQACQSQLTACLGTSGGSSSTGGTGNMTCAQVDACMMSCGDTDYTCMDNCYYQGTANAQALMTAVEDCYDNAEQVTCQSQCTSDNQQCWNCLDQACQSQLNTCLGN